MEDNIKQRIETIKSILRSITIASKDIDFMFVIIDNKDVNMLEYMFNVNDENSPKNFHIISEISNQDFFTQQRYRHEAETNKSQIVYCLNPDFVNPSAFPLMKGKMYKVLEIKTIMGQNFYELEYLTNDKNFQGYESNRFVRIVSPNSFN